VSRFIGKGGIRKDSLVLKFVCSFFGNFLVPLLGEPVPACPALISGNLFREVRGGLFVYCPEIGLQKSKHNSGLFWHVEFLRLFQKFDLPPAPSREGEQEYLARASLQVTPSLIRTALPCLVLKLIYIIQ
jgi:hypothetical protein